MVTDISADFEPPSKKFLATPLSLVFNYILRRDNQGRQFI